MSNIQLSNKFKINKLTNWLLFGTWILVIGYSATSVAAQTPTSTDSASILRDSVRQKVAEELAQIKQSVSKKGFLGTITNQGDASITITTLKNQTRNILVTNDSVIRLASGSDGTVADLKSGMFILAMGDVDSQNQMTAKRVLVVTKPTAEKRLVAFGTVSDTAVSSFTIQTGNKSSLVIKTSASTKYSEKQKAADIKAGSKVAVIYLQSGSSLTATRIHIVSSPTVTPTPKATATPRPTVRPTSTPRLSPTP